MGVHFTRRQWFIVFTLGTVNLSCGISTSLQPPFFPKEAEERGSTASEYGLVFAVFEVVSIVSCTMFGKYIDIIGANKLMYVGIFSAGITSIMFGLLDFIHSHGAFISLAIIVRIFDALAISAAITASDFTTANEFQDSIGTTYAVLKSISEVGSIFGPTIGGYLIEMGGFVAPFGTLGGFLLLQAVCMAIVLSKTNGYSNCQCKQDPTIPIFTVLKLRNVFLCMFSIVSASISIGFINVLLEPHIRQFRLSPVLIGVMFTVDSATYTLTGPLVGFLCNTGISPKKFIIFGSISIIVGYTLIGPSPFLPIDTVLSLVPIGVVLLGLGYGCVFVPAFIDGISSAVACGLPNGIAIYGVISGLTQGAHALGNTLGSSVGGLLYDAVGFRQGTLFVITIQLITIVAMTTVVCSERQPAQKPGYTDAQVTDDSDQSALLTSTSTNKDYGS